MSIIDKLNNKNSENISKILLPYNDYLIKLRKKYSNEEGDIDANKIHKDIVSLQFGVTESFEKIKNTILKFLHKFFIGIPKNIISIIWEHFKDVFYMFKTGEFLGGILGSMVTIIVAAVVFILGFVTYDLVDYNINSLDSGKVVNTKFVPAHDEIHTYYVNYGTGSHTITRLDHEPDEWFINVTGKDGKKEIWVTQDKQIGTNIEIDDTVTKDDNWSYVPSF